MGRNIGKEFLDGFYYQRNLLPQIKRSSKIKRT